jgi:hypothetical protein
MSGISLDPTTMLQYGSYLFFIIFIMYGQRIQTWQMLSAIKSKMVTLEKYRKESYDRLVKKLGTLSLMPKADIETNVKRLINSIAIPPASVDPAGIVPKMKSTFSAYENYMKANLRVMAPNVTDSELQSLTCMLEVTMTLNQIYLIVDHFYRMGKKQGMLFVYQLAMIMGMILEMAESTFAALPSFEKGTSQLIGDSFGPLVASKFGYGLGVELAPETQVHYTTFEGRDLIVVRAKGPGGTVGKPDEAVELVMRDLEKKGVNPVSMISIDAALRLESETTGDIAEGAGFAMGGSGAERWNIEQSCTARGIPSYTVVCKMNNKEAISDMPAKVLEQVNFAKERVEWFIRFSSKVGDTVIMAGIGNSQGVA